MLDTLSIIAVAASYVVFAPLAFARFKERKLRTPLNMLVTIILTAVLYHGFSLSDITAYALASGMFAGAWLMWTLCYYPNRRKESNESEYD